MYMLAKVGKTRMDRMFWIFYRAPMDARGVAKAKNMWTFFLQKSNCFFQKSNFLFKIFFFHAAMICLKV